MTAIGFLITACLGAAIFGFCMNALGSSCFKSLSYELAAMAITAFTLTCAAGYMVMTV